MTVYAIGDIHGCWNALETLLEHIPADEDDLLVTLGDYVDRGPDSYRVLEWVIQSSETGRCMPLRGNHEVMMLASLKGEMYQEHWLACGGTETLESYSPSSQRRIPNPHDVPERHRNFLQNGLLPYYETDTHIFVHAGLDSQLSVDDQDDHTLYWERFEYISPHKSGKIIVCGHTAQKNGAPADRGFAVCIDTWVYGQGWLTCLDTASGQYWQANQKGKHRTGWLESTS